MLWVFWLLGHNYYREVIGLKALDDQEFEVQGPKLDRDAMRHVCSYPYHELKLSALPILFLLKRGVLL